MTHPPLRWLLASLLVVGATAHAERADRLKPIVLESDRDCVADVGKRITSCGPGNVVVTQGTMQLRADRLEVRDTAEGFPQLQAQGTATLPARVRQRRDGPANEVVEGQAQRIHYDSRLGVLRFDGAALVRLLRDGVVADEIHGASVVWDGGASTFNVQGGQSTQANPGGRVRAVIVPRAAADGAAPPVRLEPVAPSGETRR